MSRSDSERRARPRRYSAFIESGRASGRSASTTQQVHGGRIAAIGSLVLGSAGIRRWARCAMRSSTPGRRGSRTEARTRTRSTSPICLLPIAFCRLPAAPGLTRFRDRAPRRFPGSGPRTRDTNLTVSAAHVRIGRSHCGSGAFWLCSPFSRVTATVPDEPPLRSSIFSQSNWSRS